MRRPTGVTGGMMGAWPPAPGLKGAKAGKKAVESKVSTLKSLLEGPSEAQGGDGNLDLPDRADGATGDSGGIPADPRAGLPAIDGAKWRILTRDQRMAELVKIIQDRDVRPEGRIRAIELYGEMAGDTELPPEDPGPGVLADYIGRAYRLKQKDMAARGAGCEVIVTMADGVYMAHGDTPAEALAKALENRGKATPQEGSAK